MPLRSPKMKRFIFGFQRRVWCPKWTPASSSCFMVTTPGWRPGTEYDDRRPSGWRTVTWRLGPRRRRTPPRRGRWRAPGCPARWRTRSPGCPTATARAVDGTDRRPGASTGGAYTRLPGPARCGRPGADRTPVQHPSLRRDGERPTTTMPATTAEPATRSSADPRAGPVARPQARSRLAACRRLRSWRTALVWIWLTRLSVTQHLADLRASVKFSK
jgi:hypothetical protein